jgi:hypothetical protein
MRKCLSAEKLVEPYNVVLAPFGYRLEAYEKPGMGVYQE